MKVEDIAEVYSGYAFKEFNSDAIGRPVIKIGNIQKNEAIDCYNCDYSDEITQEKYISKRGDVYVALSGATTGKVGIMAKPGYYINQRVGIIRVKNDKYPAEFIKYFLQSKTNNILAEAYGSAQPNISPKQIAKYEIPIISNIDKVTKTLHTLEDCIRFGKLSITLFDELIKSRFIELFGDIMYKNNNHKISDACILMVRGPFGSALKKEFFVPKSPNTYKVYEQKHAIKKDDAIGSYYITKEKFNSLKRFELLPGDIIMSCSGTIGEFYQLPQNCEPGIMNQALLKFRLNENVIDKTYFLHAMSVIINNVDRSGSAIKNITSVSVIKNTNLFIPELKEQKLFASFVEQIDKLKFNVQQRINYYQELLNKKMDEYFN